MDEQKFITNCCFCVHWKNCPCQWHINNAACLTIQKVISEPNEIHDYLKGDILCKLFKN